MLNPQVNPLLLDYKPEIDFPKTTPVREATFNECIRLSPHQYNYHMIRIYITSKYTTPKGIVPHSDFVDIHVGVVTPEIKHSKPTIGEFFTPNHVLSEFTKKVFYSRIKVYKSLPVESKPESIYNTLKDLFPSCFIVESHPLLTQIDTPIVRPTSTNLFAIGATPAECRVLSRYYIHNTHPGFMTSGQNESAPPQGPDMRPWVVCTTYFNTYLASLSAEVFQMVFHNLKPSILSGLITIDIITDEKINIVRGTTLNFTKTVFMAFFSLACYTKLDKPKGNDNWMISRANALFAQLGMLPVDPKVKPEPDVQILAAVLHQYSEIRKVLMAPMICNKVIKNPTSIELALQTQLRMVLSFSGINTFKLALDFAKDCSTEVHLIDEIVIQSEKIIAQYESMLGECEKGEFDVDYYCIFKTRDIGSMRTTYPDLCYCAVLMKIAMGGVTWENYDIGSLNTTIEKETLKISLAKPLKRVGSDAASQSDRVRAFLKARS